MGQLKKEIFKKQWLMIMSLLMALGLGMGCANAKKAEKRPDTKKADQSGKDAKAKEGDKKAADDASKLGSTASSDGSTTIKPDKKPLAPITVNKYDDPKTKKAINQLRLNANKEMQWGIVSGDKIDGEKLKAIVDTKLIVIPINRGDVNVDVSLLLKDLDGEINIEQGTYGISRHLYGIGEANIITDTKGFAAFVYTRGDDVSEMPDYCPDNFNPTDTIGVYFFNRTGAIPTDAPIECEKGDIAKLDIKDGQCMWFDTAPQEDEIPYCYQTK